MKTFLHRISRTSYLSPPTSIDTGTFFLSNFGAMPQGGPLQPVPRHQVLRDAAVPRLAHEGTPPPLFLASDDESGCNNKFLLGPQSSGLASFGRLT